MHRDYDHVDLLSMMYFLGFDVENVPRSGMDFGVAHYFLWSYAFKNDEFLFFECPLVVFPLLYIFSK